jgi:hypothetical protein
MRRAPALFLGLLLSTLPASAQEPASDLVPNLPPPQVDQQPIPPAPASHVLDQADVILPDVEARLSAQFLAARLNGVEVYVVTVRSLGVPPSKQSSELESRATRYCAAWCPKSVGALLLFDDEGGLMTVVTSKKAEERFTTFLLEKEFREGLAKIPPDVISRVKLERSGIVVVETLSRLQAEAVKSDRTKLIGNIVMGSLALLGIGLAIMSALAGDKPTPAEPAAE